MPFCGYLRQSTAVDILLGPFVDDTDGKTAETGLTLDVEVSKNGQALANKNDATTPTHDGAGTVDGYYNCELDATDTGTLGILSVVAHAAGFLPIHQTYQIVVAHWWDTMCSTDLLHVDVHAIDDDGTAADNLETACDNYSATRGLAGTALPAAAADAAGGLPISDAGGLDLDTQINTDIDAILADTNELQTDDIPGTLSSMDGKLDTIDNFLDTEVAAILADTNELQTDWVNGGRLDLLIDAILADTGELQTDDVPGLIGALNDVSTAEVNAQVDIALTDIHLDHLLAATYDPASKPGAADALLNELVENDGGVSRFTENALEEAPTGGSAPTATEIVDEWETQSQADPTGFHVNVMEVNSTAQTANDNGADINAILADTNELQTDWVNGGRLDLLIDAILADTAELQTDDIPGTLSSMDSKLDTIDNFLDTEVAAILADTNELQTDWVNGGRLDLLIDAILADTNELQTDDIPGTLSSMDGKLDTIDNFLDTEVAAILADTNELQTDWVNGGRLDLLIDAILADTNELQTDDVPGAIAALNDVSVTDITQRQVPDSYAADGAHPTIEQSLLMIWQYLSERSVSGTTVTVKKPDGSTPAMAFTLDDGTDPTSITRSS